MEGKPILQSAVHSALKRIAKRTGIEKRVHAHGFRHKFAYELMMEGVPMPIIQAQLGHASLDTTDTYLAHIAPKHVIETMAKRDWEP